MSQSFFGLHVPYLAMLGVQAEHREKGRTVISLELRPELTNSWKIAHGAVVMALLDASMASASRTTVEHDAGALTIEMSVSFMHGGTGRLLAEGRVLRNGKSLIFCESEVRDASGELVAKALGTYKLRRRERGATEVERKIT